MLDPLDQIKSFVLMLLSFAPEGIDEIVFPCYPEAEAELQLALELPEVKSAFSDRKMKIRIVPANSAVAEIALRIYEDLAAAKSSQN